jgi:hypothetical protein
LRTSLSPSGPPSARSFSANHFSASRAAIQPDPVRNKS